jgi:hypothetical protein
VGQTLLTLRSSTISRLANDGCDRHVRTVLQEADSKPSDPIAYLGVSDSSSEKQRFVEDLSQFDVFLAGALHDEAYEQSRFQDKARSVGRDMSLLRAGSN